MDGDAEKEKKDFNKLPENIRSAKCFVYPAPPNLRAARTAHFDVHATLEALYPQAVWVEAEGRRKLTRRDPVKVCHPDLVNRIILGETTLEDQLDPEWAYLVRHDFAADHKIATATRLSQQSDDQCRVTFAGFEPVLKAALIFLGVEVEAGG